MKVFDHYAHYYDLLYKDKDYATECQYVTSQIRQYSPQAKNILEMGCGTGRHAVELAQQGFHVEGFDLSATMLEKAQERRNQQPQLIRDRLHFTEGNALHYRSSQRHDVVLALFHVLSYQTTNEEVELLFDAASANLKDGGIFLCDYWYGPAVYHQQPTVRVKRLEDDRARITRIAEPEIDIHANVVAVKYDIQTIDKSTSRADTINEVHRMRYFFQPEIRYLARSKGFEVLAEKAWLTDTLPTRDVWGACTLFRKISAR